MKFKRKKDGTIWYKEEKGKKYTILFHGYKQKEYMVWYLDENDKKVIFDSIKLKKLLDFIENIDLDKDKKEQS